MTAGCSRLFVLLLVDLSGRNHMSFGVHSSQVLASLVQVIDCSSALAKGGADTWTG